MSESLPSIVGRLSRAGWGDLAPRSAMGARVALSAISTLVDPMRGSGLITAAQIAEVAGRSVRRIRDALHLLEDLDIISWSRGGIRDGRPVAGHIRVSKRSLWAMIRPARTQRDEARTRRAAELRTRLAGLRQTRYLVSSRKAVHHPLSVHTDVTSALPPLTGGGIQPSHPIPEQTGPDMPATCRHGVANPLHCPLCRRALLTRQDIQPADLIQQQPEPRQGGPRFSPGQRLRQLLAERSGSHEADQALLPSDGPLQ